MLKPSKKTTTQKTIPLFPYSILSSRLNIYSISYTKQLYWSTSWRWFAWEWDFLRIYANDDVNGTISLPLSSSSLPSGIVSMQLRIDYRLVMQEQQSNVCNAITPLYSWEPEPAFIDNFSPFSVSLLAAISSLLWKLSCSSSKRWCMISLDCTVQNNIKCWSIRECFWMGKAEERSLWKTQLLTNKEETKDGVDAFVYIAPFCVLRWLHKHCEPLFSPPCKCSFNCECCDAVCHYSPLPAIIHSLPSPVNDSRSHCARCSGFLKASKCTYHCEQLLCCQRRVDKFHGSIFLFSYLSFVVCMYVFMKWIYACLKQRHCSSKKKVYEEETMPPDDIEFISVRWWRSMDFSAF